MPKIFSEEARINQINAIPNIMFLRWQTDYKTNYSKAIVRCLIDGFEWPASISSLVNTGRKCPHCSKSRRWTDIERVEQINSLDSLEFVTWVGEYAGARTKAMVRCKIDGFTWEARPDNLASRRTGCPQCGKVRIRNADERVEQINSVGSLSFIRWEGCFINNLSRAVVECHLDGFQWSASVSNLLRGHGCPKCARPGFDPSKIGTLYALRSECGSYIKIGISNQPGKRHSQLKRHTPFGFSCIEKIDGDGLMIAILERNFHSKHESAGLSGFDGCTEWLVCTNELLDDLRNTRDSLHQGV